MTTQIYMTCLYTQDLHTLLHFYAEVIGLHLAPHQEGPPHLEVGDSYLIIQRGTPAKPADSGHLPALALVVEDLDQAIERLEENHIALLNGIEEHEDARWVKFYDPAGNLVELIELYRTLIFGP